MGVRGLLAWIKQRELSNVEERSASNSTLLVDAIGFALNVCQNVTKKHGDLCAFELGGPYRLIHSEILAEVRKLLEFGFKLRFLFDGNTSQNPLKDATHDKRLEDKEKKWEHVYNGALDDYTCASGQRFAKQESLPFPCLAVDELKSILLQLKLEIILCEGEADQDIAAACKEGGTSHFIYATDTDFLFFPNCSLIFFDTIEAVNSSPDLISTKVWRRSEIAKELKIEECLWVEFALLVGNDATSAVSRAYFDKPSLALSGGNGDDDIWKVADDSEELQQDADKLSSSPQRSHFPLGWSTQVLDNLLKKLVAASETHSVQLTSTSSPELQLALEYSRAFYGLHDLSAFMIDDDESAEKEKESMSLSVEQKEDIELYTDASTAEIVTSLGLDVIAYLQQAAVFEEQLTDMHIEAFELMQEAIAETMVAEETNGKVEHPLCPRPKAISWMNITAAQIFQRTYREFVKNSERHPGGPFYDLTAPSNAPSGVFDGHLFHMIMAHLEEKEKEKKKEKSKATANADAQSKVSASISAKSPASKSPASKPETGISAASPDEVATGRDKLPIDDHKDRILSRIESDRVTIIHGETGCGKSSRLPAILLEHAESRGEMCRMFVSQPRRIAASSLMKRLRTTLGDKVGLRMGHGIIDEKDETCITFVTTGYIVRLLANYPEAFKSHTHLIIDEVHERSVDGDVLCLLARRLLLVHPTIRLILMSATVHTALYKDYFANQGEYYGSMEVLSVGVRRFPVNIMYADDLEKDPDLPAALKKGSVKKIGELTSGRTKGRGDEQVPSSLAKEQYSLAVTLVRTVAKLGTGVLVFVSGLNDITELMERFEGLGRYKIVAIHSDIPFEEQEAAFEQTPPDRVKVVIATNAAESSITLPDVDLVICLGTHKALRYNLGSHRVQLVNTWISKASGTQRAGRTGRVRPGTVYRLYSRALFEGFDEHEQSEVHRQPLQDVILDLRTMLEDSAGFEGVVPILEDLLEPPDMNNVEKSFEYLHRAGMITTARDEGTLTSVGRLAGCLPVDLTLGRLVAVGITLGVGTEAAILASALSQPKSLFRLASPMIHSDPDEFNDIIQQTLVGAVELDDGCYSEPIMMLRMFLLWHTMDVSERNDWCHRNGLAHARMRQFVSSSCHLIERVNSALISTRGKKGARVNSQSKKALSLDYLPDPMLLSDQLLNTIRLILTWTADGNIIRMNPQKKQLTTADYSSVTLTGDSVTAAHLKPLFPDWLEWKFDNSLRRVFDAPLSNARMNGSSLEMLKDIAACIGNDVKSAMVWVLEQMPPKSNAKEGESSLAVAISGDTSSPEYKNNLLMIKSIFNIMLTAAGNFALTRSEGPADTYYLFVVAMVSKNELKALHSLHEHCPHCLSLLLPRQGNAKMTASNVSPSPEALRRVFFASDVDDPDFKPPKISESVQACKQVLVFPDPFKNDEAVGKNDSKDKQGKPSKNSAQKKDRKNAASSAAPGESPRPPLMIDVPLGIRLLNSYSSGYKDRKMRLWRTPKSSAGTFQKWKSPEARTKMISIESPAANKTSANPYHQRTPAPVVGSKDWTKSHMHAGSTPPHGANESEEDSKMIMPYRTVDSRWTILQIKGASSTTQRDSDEISNELYHQYGLEPPRSTKAAPSAFVAHTGPALMPRQSLQAVAVHCGYGIVWGVTHNILFIGGVQSGSQELVRCEGISLVPPGSRWLSLALQCCGMGHLPVEARSIGMSANRGLVTSPHDRILDQALSPSDVARCQEFYAAFCEHQEGPIVQNDDLIEQLSLLFAPWLTYDPIESQLRYKEGKLEDEFNYHMSKIIAEDGVKSAIPHGKLQQNDSKSKLTPSKSASKKAKPQEAISKKADRVMSHADLEAMLASGGPAPASTQTAKDEDFFYMDLEDDPYHCRLLDISDDSDDDDSDGDDNDLLDDLGDGDDEMLRMRLANMKIHSSSNIKPQKNVQNGTLSPHTQPKQEGDRYRCPDCSKMFKSVGAIVDHFSSTGHSPGLRPGSERQGDPKRGVREACLVKATPSGVDLTPSTKKNKKTSVTPPHNAAASSSGTSACLICSIDCPTLQLRNMHMMTAHPKQFNNALKDEKMSSGTQTPSSNGKKTTVAQTSVRKIITRASAGAGSLGAAVTSPGEAGLSEDLTDTFQQSIAEKKNSRRKRK